MGQEPSDFDMQRESESLFKCLAAEKARADTAEEKLREMQEVVERVIRQVEVVSASGLIASKTWILRNLRALLPKEQKTP